MDAYLGNLILAIVGQGSNLYTLVEEGKGLRNKEISTIVQALYKVLSVCGIVTLYLNGNAIGFEGLQMLLILASMYPNIEEIQVGWNLFEKYSDQKTDPIKVLEILAILKDTNLSLFDVSFTNINVDCINELIRILPFTQIRTLYINGNGVTDDQKLRIREILLSNRIRYQEKFWRSWRHLSFSNSDSSLHEMVMTSFLCDSTLSYCLPLHVWIYIFSFWQRKQFYIEHDDDDLSDGDLSDGDLSDGDLSDGEDE